MRIESLGANMAKIITLFVLGTSMLFAGTPSIVEGILFIIFLFSTPFVLILYMVTRSPFFSFIFTMQVLTIGYLTAKSFITDLQYRVTISTKAVYEAGRFVKVDSRVAEGKLFFVELANSGTIERIVSFIVVGVALLVIGYFVPLPPKQDQTADAEEAAD
jgi:hypothetical protein